MKKLVLKCGKILKVMDHENADKLYVLRVDIGHEIQLVAGLKKYFTKEELLEKNIVVVANLKPAVLRGKISQGMLLAAEKDDKIALLTYRISLPGSLVVPENTPLSELEALEGYDEMMTIDEFFDQYKFEVKDKRVYLNGLKLVTSEGEDIFVDIDDGAKVR